MMLNPDQATRRLILLPAVVTLVVTLLRLVGELRGWSPGLFNPEPGGGGALFGIWLLAPVFGVYFALKLVRAGQVPQSGWRVALRAIISLVVIVGIIALIMTVISNPIVLIPILGVLVLGAAVLLMRKSWPALFSTLVSYGLAARIPVIVIMFFAIMGNWGTHYDSPSPDFPETGPFVEWFLTGVFPQLTFWIAFTIIMGMLFGGVAAALKGTRLPPGLKEA